MINFNTPWWDAFSCGLLTGLIIWWFDTYVIQTFKKAWKLTVKEMKKREGP